MKNLAPFLMVAGGLMLIIGGSSEPTPTPETSPAAELLEQCHIAERTAKLQILADMATKTFDGDTPAARAVLASDYWLEQAERQRIDSHIPFSDRLAEHIMAETVGEFVGVK